jgi:hypothetical protein
VERAEQLASDAGEEWSALPLDRQDAWYREAKQELTGG